MENTTVCGTVYERLLADCVQYRMRGPWRRVKSPPECGALADPTATLAALQGEFAIEDLETSGVAMRDPNGAVVLNPSLAVPDEPLLFLRSAPRAAPFEVWTAAGGLAPDMFPVIAATADFLRRRWIVRDDDFLCAAASLRDVIALRSLGIPATLTTGLESLGRERLRQVADAFAWKKTRTFGWDQQKEGEPESRVPENVPPQLILVGWSPADLTLQAPPGFAGLCSHLRALGRHLELELEDVYEWRPTAEALERIRFSIAHGEGAHIRKAVRASIDGAFGLLTVGEEPASAPCGDPLPYPDALAQYRRACRAGDRTQRSRAWTLLEEALEREVLDPRVQEGFASPDPVRRSLYVAAAGLVGMIATATAPTRRKDAHGRRLVHQSEYKKLELLTNQLIKLAKEASQSGHPPPASAPGAIAADSPAAPCETRRCLATEDGRADSS